LTPVEQSLVEQVGRGGWLDLAAGEVVDEAMMRSWGDERTCRASVIRDILRGQLADNLDPHGLRLRGARISGRLDLEDLTTKVSLRLTDCLLEKGILARGANLAFFGLTGCQLEHDVEPPLQAERLICTTLVLSRARINGHAGAGAVCLSGARIAGNLECEGTSLRNNSGPALYASNLEVGQAMLLRGGFTAIGTGAIATVRLVAASVGSNLECDRASLHNDSGPALHADGLQVGRAVLLKGVTATGSSSSGAVRLFHASISGNLECDRASLRNDSGPALDAEGLQVGQSVYLRDEFTATGAGSSGAVRLTRAHIGGQLDCTKAGLHNKSGSALLAYGLQVDEAILLHDGFTAIAGGDGVAVDLTAVRVSGMLVIDPKRLGHVTNPHRRLVVDGLTYVGVPRQVTAGDWLDLLRDGTPYYAAQPYQQLAAGYRALGDDQRARKTLMRQRDDQLARTYPSRPERLWGWITKITLGYGYQPWRALLFLAAVMVISSVLAVSLGSHGALVQTSKAGTAGRSCTVLQQVSVGLDLNLPIGTSMARAGCDLTKSSASVTAGWLAAAGWGLRLLAWVFAALFIAGFTSAVRKT
jgi:hypothetical protein